MIFSIDDCDDTGDHENYFEELTDAYDIDGTVYTDCTKKAVRYRSKEEHKLLSGLTENVFLLFDGISYIPLSHKKLSNKKGILSPKYS